MKTIQLQNAMDFRIHGNLTRTTSGQIRRAIGLFSYVFVTKNIDAGTVKDSAGKFWDFWTNETGDVVVVKAS